MIARLPVRVHSLAHAVRRTATGEFSFPGVGLQFNGRSSILKIVGRFRQTAWRWRLVRLMLDSKVSPPLTGFHELSDQRTQAPRHAEAAVLRIESNFDSHHSMFPK